jgi:sigma-E factor negative regulatory protein RseC
MIEETGRVVAVDGDLAEVETWRRSACGHCAGGQQGCGTSLLAEVFGNRPSHVRVLNRISALPGDEVVIGVEEGAFLRATALLYGMPLLGLIVGAMLGKWLALRSGLMGVEPASLIAGLLGLAGALAWVRWRVAHGSRGGTAYQAVILRRSGSRAVPLAFP